MSGRGIDHRAVMVPISARRYYRRRCGAGLGPARQRMLQTGKILVRGVCTCKDSFGAHKCIPQ